MDPDRTEPTTSIAFDDVALGAVVRDVTDDWRLPPQRLDQVTWRERVGRGHTGPTGGGRSGRWSRRLLGAAAVAVVATVSLAYGAVWMNGSRGGNGAAVPTAGASPAASSVASPRPTPLPAVALNGDVPEPAQVMIRSEGRYRVADLQGGALGTVTIPTSTGPSTVIARPGGGWVCICGDWTQLHPGGPNGLRLTLYVVDQGGALVETKGLKELSGSYDPDVDAALQPQLVDAHVTTTLDGASALIGWSRRDGADGWTIGVDELDLRSLEELGSLDVAPPESSERRRPPDDADGTGGFGGSGGRRSAPEQLLVRGGRQRLGAPCWYRSLDDPVRIGSADA